MSRTRHSKGDKICFPRGRPLGAQVDKKHRNKNLRCEFSSDSDANAEAPVAGIPSVAVCRAEAGRTGVPRTAAHDTARTVPACGPSRTVYRCSVIGLVPAILGPLKHIPDHVI